MEKRCPRREIEVIRALLFASGEPVSLKDMSKVLSLPKEICEKLTLQIQKELAEENSGIRVLRLEDRFQMSTSPAYYPDIELLYKQQAEIKLTDTQLETLAIITYRQPVTRQEISDIRGVASDAVVARLITMGLVEEAGRVKAPGRPVLLKTSDAFLKAFQLERVADLPHLPDSSHSKEDVEEEPAGLQQELDMEEVQEKEEE